jgi:hypothetical protein
MNEEEFNHIAYSYRSWPSTDPIGVSERYDELVNYVQSITHPVKTLTDEEIYACFHQYFALGEPKPTHYELEYEDLIDFARAILRKAQEK